MSEQPKEQSADKPAEIKAGRVYHFIDSQEPSVYAWAKENQRTPLTITRVADEVKAAYGEHQTILLSTAGLEGSVSPAELARIRTSIQPKIVSKDNMVILGTGAIDYLVNQNNISNIVSFLESLRDGVYRTEGIVAAELNLEDVDRRAAYQRLIRTAPLYRWPLGKIEIDIGDEDAEDAAFANDLDKLLAKRVQKK